MFFFCVCFPNNGNLLGKTISQTIALGKQKWLVFVHSSLNSWKNCMLLLYDKGKKLMLKTLQRQTYACPFNLKKKTLTQTPTTLELTCKSKSLTASFHRKYHGCENHKQFYHFKA